MVTLHIIESGYFLGDGGVMFGSVPKRYWSAKYPVDDHNMCAMALRCLFIDTGDRRILVDAGIGNKHDNRLKFYHPYDQKDIAQAIREIGYAPEEVTDVILTHLHFDHCGGSTVLNTKGKAVPTYPNATYWVSLDQWENYRNPMLFEKGSFFADNIEPVHDAGQLQLVEGDTRIDEHICLELYDGHSPGQIVVLIDTQQGDYAFPGDVVPTSLNLSLSWVSAYDNSAAIAMEEKKRFLDKAKVDQRTLIFCHDAYTVSAKL
ncbi:MAG TPA: MBL fold metallo-hydrolase [Bacteroidales bacterium]|jgi:glyoxylase-like metal-dependent hydrolase (beta-lactamase superfamily II)|nr:MBL fold metallo-hydrolase [Bacteroidales bacterium]